MLDQIFLDHLLSESEYVRICGIDDCPDPMCTGMTEGFQAGKVFDHAPALRAEKRLVDAKEVSVSVHVDDGLAERQRLLFQCGPEFVETSCPSCRGRL